MAQFSCPSLIITFSAVFLTLLSLTSAGMFLEVLYLNSVLNTYPASTGQDCLSGHNYYRQLHGVQPLEYDRTLEQFAMKRVAYMAKTDIFAHPRNLPYGENLYWKVNKPAIMFRNLFWLYTCINRVEEYPHVKTPWTCGTRNRRCTTMQKVTSVRQQDTSLRWFGPVLSMWDARQPNPHPVGAFISL